MTERERLIEILSRPIFPKIGVDPAEVVADYLLDNGIIAPPCKVGDIVYSIQECSCEDIDGVHTECEFYGYGADDRICAIPNGEKCPYQYRVVECYVMELNILMFTREWGKTVFLTREDAEKALAERGRHETQKHRTHGTCDWIP